MRNQIVKVLFPLFALLFTFTFASTIGAQQTKPRTAIEAGAKELMDAVAKGDSVAIAATYTPDAKMFPANSDTISGRDAIQKLWQGWIDEGLGGLVLEATEIKRMGDMGYDISMYKLIDKEGKVFDHGKSLVVWKKHQGKWKLYRDIWTTSMPATSQ